MAAKRPDNCYTCHFWEGQGIRQRGPKGVCRRYPPTVTPRHNDGRFPVTLASDWCGEWRRAVADLATAAAPRSLDDYLG